MVIFVISVETLIPNIALLRKDEIYHRREFLNPILESSEKYEYLENVKKHNNNDESLKNFNSDIKKIETQISKYKNLNFIDKMIFQVRENTPSRLQQELSSSKFLFSKAKNTKIMREKFITDCEYYLKTFENT